MRILCELVTVFRKQKQNATGRPGRQRIALIYESGDLPAVVRELLFRTTSNWLYKEGTSDAEFLQDDVLFASYSPFTLCKWTFYFIAIFSRDRRKVFRTLFIKTRRMKK